MKLSCVDDDKISSLSPEQKEKIVFGGVDKVKGMADVGIVLGGPVEVMRSRAKVGAQAYVEGRVKRLIVSGEPYCETPEYGKQRECEQLKSYLVDFGVKAEDIYLEPCAKTTVENMIFSALVIQRNFDIANVKSVMIITSYSHIKRSMMYAEMFLPKFFKFYAEYTGELDEINGNWVNSEFQSARMDAEIWLMRQMIITGQIPDIEF